MAVWQPKTRANVGTIWRTAQVYGASFMATIGKSYAVQNTDTMKASRHVPLFAFDDLDQLIRHAPSECVLVAVEICEFAEPLHSFEHPQRALYLLGTEDTGLPSHVLERCHRVVCIPAPSSSASSSLNVGVAASIVMYDRFSKRDATNVAPLR